METTTKTTFLVADSSGLVSLFAPDRNHDRAVAAARELGRSFGTFVLPSDVFAETVNTLYKRFGRAVAIDAARYLVSTPPFLPTEADAELRSDALERFSSPSSLGYTDCAVLAFADHFGTDQIFGFDDDFVRQGYRIIDKALRSL
jgi:predicted nucleic acid-binding protein